MPTTTSSALLTLTAYRAKLPRVQRSFEVVNGLHELFILYGDMMPTGSLTLHDAIITKEVGICLTLEISMKEAGIL